MAEEIKDISLSTKKSYRIDGDNSRIIYLDTSDMNVLVRLEEIYPDIQKLALEAGDRILATKDTDSEESSLNDITEVLKDIDKKIMEKLLQDNKWKKLIKK